MRNKFRLLIMMMVVGGLTACADVDSDPAVLPQDIVERALVTVDRFKHEPDLAKFAKYMPGARAVVVLPNVIKAGLLGAAEVGHGVMLAKRADGSWSYPAFYTLGSGSIGFQIGIQSTEVILVVRTDQALQSLMKHQAKFGADTGITVGVVGVGMEAAITTDPRTYILAFANAKMGAFGGASLEGAVLARRNDLNEAYYGKGATPQAIALEGKFTNAKADGLRKALAIR